MVSGFIGKLLQWWNNCLIEESKEDIKNAIQKDEEGTPIFDECIGRGIPDGVNTLIYAIMKHFIGKPSNITSRIYDQLNNLRSDVKPLATTDDMKMSLPLELCT